MVAYSLDAELDLDEIVSFTAAEWGARQADYYLSELTDCFYSLAKAPLMGRLAAKKFPIMRRMEKGSHVIFYEPRPTGIFVVRVLHRRMLPQMERLLSQDRDQAYQGTMPAESE